MVYSPLLAVEAEHDEEAAAAALRGAVAEPLDVGIPQFQPASRLRVMRLSVWSVIAIWTIKVLPK